MSKSHPNCWGPDGHTGASGDMNRAQRRAGRRNGTICEHGYVMKTDGRGMPLCPHRCGFELSPGRLLRPDDDGGTPRCPEGGADT